VSADSALARAEWQPVIFGERLRRASLLALVPSWPLRPFRLHVLRNHSFEFVASVLRPFLAYAGWESQITYSGYDDSFSEPPDPDADVVMVWVDFDRYRLDAEQLAEWMNGRLTVLRQATDSPILISDWGAAGDGAVRFNAALRASAEKLPDVYLAEQSAVARSLGDAYLDRRSALVSAMALSDAACLETARQLGLDLLPGLLEPGIKAVALDFDGTLYEGVLGDDGPGAIVITSAHADLHRRLLELRDRGIFLAGVTRNEPADVDRLFTERKDFTLRREHFSSLVAGWDPKAKSLDRVAGELRIGVDAILFIDDNAGELASAASELPGIRCFHAGEPRLTIRALGLFPGLKRFVATASDRLRVRDLAAAAERDERQRQSADPDSYLRSLDIELGFAVDSRADLQRMHELSNKTNQFNTALLRLSAVEVTTYMDQPERHVVSISLRDRLSESGVIGAVFTRLDGRRLMVDEVDISCRALGRRLERLMVLEAVRRAIGLADVAEVAFRFRSGPRNVPARQWLEELAGPFHDGAGPAAIPWDAAEVARLVASAPVRVRDGHVLEQAA
jgi:FkbH-like protein